LCEPRVVAENAFSEFLEPARSANESVGFDVKALRKLPGDLCSPDRLSIRIIIANELQPSLMHTEPLTVMPPAQRAQAANIIT